MNSTLTTDTITQDNSPSAISDLFSAIGVFLDASIRDFFSCGCFARSGREPMTVIAEGIVPTLPDKVANLREQLSVANIFIIMQGEQMRNERNYIADLEASLKDSTNLLDISVQS